MTKDAFNKIVLTLLEATVTLYPAQADGSPVLSSPLWSGCAAENLVVRETWISVETRPTGARTPKDHPLVQTYEVSVDRVWLLPLEQLEDFTPTYEHYVLDVTWQEEESGQWHRRTFYGVTFGKRELSTRSIDEGSTDAQSMKAEFMNIESGVTGPIPAISSSAPYRVVWRGGDGTVTLYSYNATTHAFAALASTTGRATIGYDTGVWKVIFDGQPATVTSTANGLSSVFLEAIPDNAQLPRLDFMYGNTRVATITPTGLWARSFDDTAAAAAGTGKFQIYNASTLVATFATPKVQADTLTEP